MVDMARQGTSISKEKIEEAMIESHDTPVDEAEMGSGDSRINKYENPPPIVYDYKRGMEKAMIKTANLFNYQLMREDVERRKIILYLKILLPLITAAPLTLVVALMVFNVIKEPIAVIGSIVSAIVAIPIGIIGVFKVISEKLFADAYRTSLPELLGKYKEFTEGK